MRLLFSVELVIIAKGLIYLSYMWHFLQNECIGQNKCFTKNFSQHFNSCVFKISSNKTLNSVGNRVKCVLKRQETARGAAGREAQLVSAQTSTKRFLWRSWNGPNGTRAHGRGMGDDGGASWRLTCRLRASVEKYNRDANEWRDMAPGRSKCRRWWV